MVSRERRRLKRFTFGRSGDCWTAQDVANPNRKYQTRISEKLSRKRSGRALTRVTAGMNSLPRQVLQIDAKLLALFIEMTSFEPQRFCGLRDLAAMPLEFGKNGSTFVGLHPI